MNSRPDAPRAGIGAASANRAVGFTLPEVMLTAALGLALLTVLVSQFPLFSVMLHSQRAVAALHSRGAVALGMLQADLYRAGYTGCRGQTGTGLGAVRIENTDSPGWGEGTPLQRVRRSALSGQQALNLGYAIPPGAQIAGDITVGEDLRITTSIASYGRGDELLLADCEGAELLSTTSIVRDGDLYRVRGTAGRVEGSYGEDARLYPWKDIGYYLRRTTRRGRDDEPILSLYRIEGRGSSQEMVAGIAAMRVQQHAQGVELVLLVEADAAGVGSQEQQHDLFGELLVRDSTRLARVFRTAVAWL